MSAYWLWNVTRSHGMAHMYAVPKPRQYLDGGGAPFLVPALAEQAVGFHIVARHRHGLHHMQAVAETQTDRAADGSHALGSSKQVTGC